ncbi:ATP-binding protein [Agromyces sp. LHK192]|uniref:ATP-binding protein n=1 Tax=Agromyces sp. LHK192 TaxID=2498704 RepID=UPI0013E3FFCB|nr:SbcC/MukB-like Walker B domain-containing protein [Agromyces sp. LHK192]
MGLFPESHWRIETIEVVNWGGFHRQPATFSFHSGASIVTGFSGVGKSTVLDAYLALMMPSSVRFNGASNAATSGKARSAEQRNLVTYLRGKTNETREEGRLTDKVLRGDRKPTWGAVAATFVSDSDERFTVARGYHVPAVATRDGEVVKRMMTLTGTLNVRDLEAFAKIGGDSFPESAMRAKWPSIKVHQSYEEFAQKLSTNLGIGAGGDGSNALALLARIQEGAHFPTVDSLYKQLVIEKPDTYSVADEAIEAFNGLDDMYQKMEISQQQANLLAPIVEAFEAMEAAQREVDTSTIMGSLHADDTPAGLWRLRAHAAVLDAEDDDLQAQVASKREEQASAEAAAAEIQSKLTKAEKDLKAAGGDQITELTQEISALDVELDVRCKARSRLHDALTGLDVSIESEHDLLDLHAASRDHKSRAEERRAELDVIRDRLVREEWPTNAALKEVREEVASLKGRSGRVDSVLDANRRKAAELSGLNPEDLPFVAELINVAAGEEQWRVAIETVLHSSARTLLVPLEHLERFSRAIDGHLMSPRLVFEGVQRGAPAQPAPIDPDRLAGKLEFKPSPYQAWVIEHVSHPSRNALCVPSPVNLVGDGLRVTLAGQTRRRRSGAHGRSQSRLIIGFDNDDLKAELRRREEELLDSLRDAEAKRAAVAADVNKLNKAERAYDRTDEFTWAQIDVESVRSEAAKLRELRQELRDGKIGISALEGRVKQLDDALDEERGRRHVLDRDLKVLDKQRADLAPFIDKVKLKMETLEDDPSITITSNLSAKLDAAWADVIGEETPNRASWASFVKRLDEKLAREAETALDVVVGRRRELERTFSQFQERWYDPNRGEKVSSYRDYLAILEEINRVGIHSQREKWRRNALQWSGKYLRLLGSSMTSALEEIEDRLHSVNDILRELPFGPTHDRLKIELRRLAPKVEVEFRKGLSSFAKMSTAGASDEVLMARFTEMRVFMAQIRTRNDPRLTASLADYAARDEILDVRRHVEITARQFDSTGAEVAEYASLAGKSGGEMQELVAFIVGAALRFQLGDESRERPRFAPVFLDEGFIKADSEFAGRAVEAWKGLGFQLIIGAPVDKYSGLVDHVGRTLVVTKNRDTGHSFVDHILHDGDKGATA